MLLHVAFSYLLCIGIEGLWKVDRRAVPDAIAGVFQVFTVLCTYD
jgi:hypothetical protein